MSEQGDLEYILNQNANAYGYTFQSLIELHKNLGLFKVACVEVFEKTNTPFDTNKLHNCYSKMMIANQILTDINKKLI